MIKKLNASGLSALTKLEMKNVKGGITPDMAACVIGAWSCYGTLSFCKQWCPTSYCCSECPAHCDF